MASVTSPPIGTGVAPRSIPRNWSGIGGGAATQFGQKGFRLASPFNKRGPLVQREFSDEPPPPPDGGLTGTRDPLDPRPPVIGGQPWEPPAPGTPVEPPIRYPDAQGPEGGNIMPGTNIYRGIPGFESWSREGPGPYGKYLYGRPGARGNPTLEEVQRIGQAIQAGAGGVGRPRRGGAGHGIGIGGTDLMRFKRLLQKLAVAA